MVRGAFEKQSRLRLHIWCEFTLRPCAKTIIVLGNGGDWVHSDQKVLRTILTMQGMPSPPRGMLLCDVCRDENRELFEDIGGARVRAIVARDIGRVCA